MTLDKPEPGPEGCPLKVFFLNHPPIYLAWLISHNTNYCRPLIGTYGYDLTGPAYHNDPGPWLPCTFPETPSVMGITVLRVQPHFD